MKKTKVADGPSGACLQTPIGVIYTYLTCIQSLREGSSIIRRATSLACSMLGPPVPLHVGIRAEPADDDVRIFLGVAVGHPKGWALEY